ncbi:hypothetical protein VPH35_040931 [Triticum aestivum]
MAQWWEEWQLRILVLASLGTQYFLVCYLPAVSFRLAHIGSDALAIFALAMLFNRQKGGPRCSYARTSRDFELLWAPVMLMHLGGQVVITIYSFRSQIFVFLDILNELQYTDVTVALYVFYKSWSSDDKRLLAATVMLFILVIIRCFQKALDLKSSSFNALRKKSSFELRYTLLGTDLTEINRLEDYVLHAKSVFVRCGEPLKEARHSHPRLPYELFFDFPCRYDYRLHILESFWSLDAESAYRSIDGADDAGAARGGGGGVGDGVLSAMTSFLYTKDHSTHYIHFKNAIIFRRCTKVLAYATLITVICLVHTRRNKEAYIGEDTRVTLVLLYGTLLLELVYLYVRTAFRDRFSGRVLQYSIIGSLPHNRWHARLRSITGWLQCKDLVDEYFGHMEPTYSCKEITKLVLGYVRSGWKDYIVDSESYRRFNDNRAERVCSQRPTANSRKSSRLKKHHGTKMGFTQKVVEKCKEGSIPNDSFVRDAWLLVVSFQGHVGDKTRMWEVIQGVWVEMLCFSAGRCRGYLHAEALGTGVEYLSYVWVLLAHTGMETFSEKLQRRDDVSFDCDEPYSLARKIRRTRSF